MAPLPPIPRKLIFKNRTWVLKPIGYLLILAAFAGCAFFMLALINEGLLRWRGQIVDADVSSLHEHPNHSGTYDRVVNYRYALPGQAVREDHSLVTSKQYVEFVMATNAPAPRPDDIEVPPGLHLKMKVLAYRIGPLVWSRAVAHDYGEMLWIIPAIFVPVLAFLAFSLYLAIVIRPRWNRRLFTHGTAVPGRVTRKYTTRMSRGDLLMMEYAFTTSEGAGEIVGRSMVPDYDTYESLTMNQAVTVLYDPRKPKRNAVYEYGGYICA